MKNMIIGAITGYTFKDIEPFVVSLEQTGYAGYKVMIVYDDNKDLQDRLVRSGWIVNKRYLDKNSNIVVQRFSDYEDFISRFERERPPGEVFLQENIDKVLLVDVGDVIFQKNPDWYLEGFDGEFILASEEGFKYRDEPWSYRNALEVLNRKDFESMLDVNICCAGVIAGSKNSIINLCQEIAVQCFDLSQFCKSGGGPDQTVYNFIVQNDDYFKVIRTTNNNTWACQVGTTLPAIRAGAGDIGHMYVNGQVSLEEYQEKILADEPKMDIDGIIINHNGFEYTIVHQYNRVPEWKNIIHNKYKFKNDVSKDNTIIRVA